MITEHVYAGSSDGDGDNAQNNYQTVNGGTLNSPRLLRVTSLPTWAVWTLSFGSPAITAVIAGVGQYLTRRAARDLETRSRREEVMRNLRWAAELAVSDDVAKVRLGIEQLQELRNSKMLNPSEEGFIDAALRAAIEVPRQLIAEAAGATEVVVITDPDVTTEPPVSSEETGQQGEASI